MSNALPLQLVIAGAMVSSTVLLHLGGLGALLMLLRVHRIWFSRWMRGFDQVVVIFGVAFGLFALHTVEIWLYAGLYRMLPTGTSFEEALYFSTVTYATIGYGDLTLPRDWRILGAIEGANGVILLGWSTAFFVSVVARLRALEHTWLGEPPDRSGPRPPGGSSRRHHQKHRHGRRNGDHTQ